jgi:hypothetical protein
MVHGKIETTDQLHSWHFHSSESFGEAWLGHRLEHLSHLRVLTEKVVHFLDACSRTARDAFAS